jgi:large subunit ribosomal protein L23
MSIFNLRKKKTEKETGAKVELGKASAKAEKIEKVEKSEKIEESTEFSPSVILKPRVTEKATDVQKNNVYVFEVHPLATKELILRAVRELYKVEPRRINVVKNPSKRVFIRGKRGVKTGVKKAYIYLKQGDKIEIV